MNLPSRGGVTFALIRGGTSRGAYFRDSDLPAAQPERDATILQLFRGEAGILADGIGGENPVLRKTAVLARLPDEDGDPVIRYDFGQVADTLDTVARNAECGNIAAGVPLFAWLAGWVAPPREGEVVRLLLTNSGIRVRAQWQTVGQVGGTLQLHFPTRSTQAPETLFPLGEPRSVHPRERPIHYSVVQGLNTYLILRSDDFGIPDPLVVSSLPDEVFEVAGEITDSVRERIGSTPLKVCLAARDGQDDAGIRARILYPSERKLHPSFAVTGAVTLALARTLPDNVFGQPVAGECFDLRLHHPSGVMGLACRMGEPGQLSEVALDRTCRLIAECRSPGPA